MEEGKVKRVGRVRPRVRPQRVAGDKAYTGQPIRAYLHRQGIGAVIPRRANEARQGTQFNRQAYRERPGSKAGNSWRTVVGEETTTS